MHRVISTSDPDFAAAGLRELRRVDPSLAVVATLAPGVSLLRTQLSFDELTRRLRDHPPVFIRHLCPVDELVDLSPLPDRSAMLAALREAAVALAPRLDPARRFSVQTRLFGDDWPFGPFDVNQALSEAVREATGAPLDVRKPEQVFSVLLHAAEDGEGRRRTGYLGLSGVEQNISAWTGGARRFAREPDQISRSEFKLLEAVELFGLSDWIASLATRGRRQATRGRQRGAAPKALDLGAAPGGWTRLLRAWGFEVVAVDPAPLDPRLEADPHVRHVPLTAEAFLQRNRERFDLITNDIRLDARDSARLMRTAARALSVPDGRALMTLKLPSRDPEQVMHQALAHLLGRYRLIGARQLFHNRNEVTVVLARREETATAAAG